MDESWGGGLQVELLPARQGDAILVSWTAGARPHRMLIDAGPSHAYDAVQARMREIVPDGPLDLLVLTHVDADHVEGTILLVNDASLGLEIGEVWHNSSKHLTDELAPVHGEILGRIVEKRGIPWNDRFAGRAVGAPGDGPLPVRTLPGGLRLTVLGPSPSALRGLRDVWLRACSAANLDVDSEDDALAALAARPKLSPLDSYLGGGVPDPRRLAESRTGADRSETNASSIVLLVEYGDTRVLLAGDATPAELLPAVRRLLAERGADRLPLSAFKLPHHGSQNNIDAELVVLLPAERYLFSSDGSQFGHPDDEAVGTVVMNAPAGAELVFNYENDRTARWADDELCGRYGYSARYPETAGAGVRTMLGGPAGAGR